MTSLLINAGPGTGKTYTATNIPRYLKAVKRDVWLKNHPHTQEQLDIWQWVENNILPQLPPDPKILYTSYNAEAVDDAKPKLPPGVDAFTTHGAGYRALNRKFGFLKINKNRGADIVSAITGINFFNMKDRFKWLATLRYIEKLKDEMKPLTIENCQLMREKYDSLANLPLHDDLIPQAQKILPAMKTIDRKMGIEYIDQIWLPLFILNTPIYHLGIIDECQDMSPARLELTKKLCKHTVYVGDPDQAINAFAGADPHAFDKIRDKCDVELSLKESFRNPPNIVLKANDLMRNRVIPDSAPRTWLRTSKEKDGKVVHIDLDNLPKLFTDEKYGPIDPSTCMIICRYNAPLVACILKLFKANIPAVILGKSIVTELVNLVKNRKAIDLDDLVYKLDKYEEYTCKSVPSHLKQAVRDKIDCVRLILTLCDDLDDVEKVLNKVYKAKADSSVSLSTIHKAKGKERQNVCILYPPVESEWATTTDAKQQEQNLHYVALTRTINNLYYITPSDNKENN